MTSRSEIYLTEDGLDEFKIRPAIDIQILPTSNSKLEKFSFGWDIIEFQEN